MAEVFVIECLIFTLVLTYFILTLFKNSKSTEKQLPGPFCLPVVGHVQLFYKKEPHLYLAELGETYGEIYKVKLGTKTVVVLNSMAVIKEAFNEWTFAGRPTLHSVEIFDAISNSERLAFLTSGPKWKFLKKNAVKALSIFAFSKSSRLAKVVEEGVTSFHQDIMNHLDQPFNPRTSVGECIAGIIGSINFGIQFNRKDPLLEKVILVGESIGTFIQLGTIVDYFPMGTILMRYKISQFKKAIAPLAKMIKDSVTSHEFSDDVTDVADALYKRRQEISPQELAEVKVTEEEIQMISEVLFTAGFNTTTETLNWFLTFMAAFPEVQNKVAEELKKNIQPGVFPSSNDIKSTPYMEATLLEVLRFSSLLPLNLPHYTTEDCQFHGYHIPKNTTVISNLWSAHYDPQTFEKPWEFIPERFLHPDGSLNIDLAQNIAPFSVGKRRCIGENLARQELYMLLAATIIRFTIRPAPGVFIDVHDSYPGLNRRAKDYLFIFSLRN